jgi:hypothetical protein
MKQNVQTDVYSNQHHIKIKEEETIQCAFYGNGKYVDIFFESENPIVQNILQRGMLMTLSC